jgi:hypothetical protein
MAEDQKVSGTTMLSGIRTYLMGGGVIVHQVAKQFGLDIDDSLYSAAIDVVLGVGVIYFRFRASQNATPVAEQPKKEGA